MPVYCLKHKYSVSKRVGGYRSGHNDGLRGMKRHKENDKVKAEIRASQPKMILVLQATGKKKMIKV